MTERFERNTGILARAWLDGTLREGSCTKCAVGNMIAGNMGYKVTDALFWKESGHTVWPRWLPLIMGYTMQHSEKVRALAQIASTGYGLKEVALIEETFEGSVREHRDRFPDSPREEATFKGLMDVVDLMAGFDNIDLKTVEDAKKQFEKV